MRLKNEDKITEILKKISPGTPIRNGLENILRARTGALLYFTDNEENINKLVAIATSKWVLYDFELNRITKLTNEIYGQYNPENIHVFENKEIDRIKEPINTNFEFDYMVRRSDIDINRHMHNLNYLKLAYEVLPENIYFGEELNNVRIMYKHQILFGEIIRCYYSKEKEKNIIVMKSADNKVLHSIVQIS